MIARPGRDRQSLLQPFTGTGPSSRGSWHAAAPRHHKAPGGRRRVCPKIVFAGQESLGRLRGFRGGAGWWQLVGPDEHHLSGKTWSISSELGGGPESSNYSTPAVIPRRRHPRDRDRD